jgi:hypothetical protein
VLAEDHWCNITELVEPESSGEKVPSMTAPALAILTYNIAKLQRLLDLQYK